MVVATTLSPVECRTKVAFGAHASHTPPRAGRDRCDGLDMTHPWQRSGTASGSDERALSERRSAKRLALRDFT